MIDLYIGVINSIKVTRKFFKTNVFTIDNSSMSPKKYNAKKL